MELKGKTAVVTGANSGIGKAIALALAGQGANVVLAARRQSRNEKLAEEIEERFSVRTLPLEIDVAREADCERLIRETLSIFGALHVLVNNAGIGGGGTIAETSTEDFDRVLKTNLYGPFWCARAAFPQIAKNRGNPRGAIINVSSVAGKEAWSGTGSYSASKFGLMALTYALADEGKAKDIKAAALCPAMVATAMTKVKGPDYLQPEDCAEAVLFLLRLSPAAWPVELVLPRKGA